MNVTSAADVQWSAVSPELCSGPARAHLITVPPDETDLRAMTVELQPGARSAWHSHPCGQLLIAISGAGRVQAADGPIVELRPGDSVWAPPGESHWHGAAPDAAFVYTSVQPADPVTGEHVIWAGSHG